MSALQFTPVENGEPFDYDDGFIKLGYCNGEFYTANILINPLEIVKKIHNLSLSNYNASLHFFIDKYLDTGVAILHFYYGSSLISSINVTNLDCVSLDVTGFINQELYKFEHFNYTNNIPLRIDVEILGMDDDMLECGLMNSFIELISLKNDDTFKRPHLGITPQVNINSDKNISLPISTPYIGSTLINPNISRIRHYFDLFTIEANQLSFNLSLIYDSYFNDSLNPRPTRFNFGLGFNLNIDEYIIKNSSYDIQDPFSDKSITLFDSNNNKIEFTQKWYYFHRYIDLIQYNR